MPVYSSASHVVSSEGYHPFGLSHFRPPEPDRGLSCQREFPPFGMVPQSFRFQPDISRPKGSPGGPFAFALNHRLPNYCDRSTDADAWALDAFSIRWSDFLGYTFPSFCLIPSVLEKVAQDSPNLLLVAPFWPKKPWFPHLLSLLAGPPKSLPGSADSLLQSISWIPYPDPLSLHLTLWSLSGCLHRRQDFLRGLPIFQPELSDPLPDQLTIQDWMPSLSAAPIPRSIRIPPL